MSKPDGWARHLKGNEINAYSAGIETTGLNPDAVKVVAEAGVDISEHSSKQVDDLSYLIFDYVVTICDHASERGPVFRGNAKVIDDPPRLAENARTEHERLKTYRRVHNEIRSFMASLPERLTE